MAVKTIKIGLAAHKSSYYDPQTNTYLTLENPRTTLTFDDVSVADQQKLSKIAHGLFAQFPALVLYEGQLPAETVSAWKGRYDAWGGPQAKARADKTNSGIQPVNALQVPTELPHVSKEGELDLFTAADKAEAASAEASAAPVVVEDAAASAGEAEANVVDQAEVSADTAPEAVSDATPQAAPDAAAVEVVEATAAGKAKGGKANK